MGQDLPSRRGGHAADDTRRVSPTWNLKRKCREIFFILLHIETKQCKRP
jgi:hypothetical protein